jgi:hypothetical protein
MRATGQLIESYWLKVSVRNRDLVAAAVSLPASACEIGKPGHGRPLNCRRRKSASSGRNAGKLQK